MIPGTPLLPHYQPIRRKSAHSDAKENSDPLPKWFSLYKLFMVKQNTWSWFLDTSLPSPQVTGLLNKVTVPYQPTLASRVLAFEPRTAEPEFSNTTCLPAGSSVWPVCHQVPLPKFTYLYTNPSESAVRLWFQSSLDTFLPGNSITFHTLPAS